MSPSTPLGTVLDGRYCLVQRLEASGDRERFVAEDILQNTVVELELLTGHDGPQRYDVRARTGPGQARAAPRAPNRRALERFTDRIVLTGVAMRDRGKLVFSGWDRRRNRAVRIIVEDDDTELATNAA